MKHNFHSPFAIPATVNGYLTDPAMRTGIDALLMFESDALPPDLEFDQLGDYIAARAAAELARFDWTGTLRDLWSRVWGQHINQDWKAASFAELIDADCSVTPYKCWDEGALTLYHSRGRYFLYTGVAFDQKSTTIAFSIEDKSSKCLIQANGPWQIDADWPGWLLFSQKLSPAASEFNLVELEQTAREAIDAVLKIAVTGK